MEHCAVDSAFPEWDVWLNSFCSEVLPQAQGLDSLLSSHPIEVPVQYSSEVNQSPVLLPLLRSSWS